MLRITITRKIQSNPENKFKRVMKNISPKIHKIRSKVRNKMMRMKGIIV